MNAEPDLVTVFRSMEVDAKDDCEDVVEMLKEEGISAVLWDDSFPGVPEGVFEVRVPAADGPKAEQLIAENPLSDEVEQVDASANLNLETVYQSSVASNIGEIEAMGVKNLLEANGIAAVMVGDSVLPNLPFEVRVARDKMARARQLLAEAESTGPAEAEQAGLESETPSS
ncbi:MAG TPA: DUF2007 domain-containing protein [Bryobacteraceae bacterium]|nr:DUF2007 domain-containing protein [Bryobacteraceae bacterium]